VITVGADITVRPEVTRHVALKGWGPDSPHSTYVRGVIGDGDHGVLLLRGRNDSALITEG
jgi:hypothetical protein